ncbi:unnamed protein product [Nyctereutes procyonoides]|uniref:(raccoon dog) hypothetical protein n=1 Tax=Nyctereutes procyonoides TaxID=34880 RepID=A0A811ZCD6_NYCPR|nr:unnamed protein product [Nyctereutes procyonoides]
MGDALWKCGGRGRRAWTEHLERAVAAHRLRKGLSQASHNKLRVNNSAASAGVGGGSSLQCRPPAQPLAFPLRGGEDPLPAPIPDSAGVPEVPDNSGSISSAPQRSGGCLQGSVASAKLLSGPWSRELRRQNQNRGLGGQPSESRAAAVPNRAEDAGGLALNKVKKAGWGPFSEPGCPEATSAGRDVPFYGSETPGKLQDPPFAVNPRLPRLSPEPPFSGPLDPIPVGQRSRGRGPSSPETWGGREGRKPQAVWPEREANCKVPAALFRFCETTSPWLFHFPPVPGFLISRDHIPSNIYRGLIPPALSYAPSLPLARPHPLCSRFHTPRC